MSISSHLTAEQPLVAEHSPPSPLPPAAPHIERLNLVHFRNHPALQLTPKSSVVVLYGPNGAGKTSILEAISLLSVGRGLQQASPKSLQHQSFPNAATIYPDHTPWSVSAHYKLYGQHAHVGTSPHLNKRRIYLNGEEVRHQEVAHHFNSFWLTPEMEHLLRAPLQEKRRFLDQIIGRFDREHPKRVARFETLQRQYFLLCTEKHPLSSQKLWRATLQEQLIQATIALSSSRIGFVGRFNRLAQSLAQALPIPNLSMEGSIAEQILEGRIATTEEFCKKRLEQMAQDKKHANLQDHLCFYDARNLQRDSASFSSGERKALMMATVLVIAHLWLADKGFAPLLLLDDVTSHFDASKQKALWHDMHKLGGQIWLTGQDREAFQDINEDVAFFYIAPGYAERQPEPQAEALAKRTSYNTLSDCCKDSLTDSHHSSPSKF